MTKIIDALVCAGIGAAIFLMVSGRYEIGVGLLVGLLPIEIMLMRKSM